MGLIILSVSACAKRTSEEIPEKIPTVTESNNILMPEERKLAKDLNYDERALAAVKHATASDFQKYVLNAEHNPDPPPMKQLREYDENRGRCKPSEGADGWSARYHEIMKILSPYRPFLLEEEERKEAAQPGYQRWDEGLRGLYSDKTNEQIAEDLKQRFAGKPVPERFKQRTVLRFFVPDDYGMYTVGSEVKFIRPLYADRKKHNPTAVLKQLRSSLVGLGYNVFRQFDYSHSRSFDDKEEAIRFANSFELPQWRTSVGELTKPRTHYVVHCHLATALLVHGSGEQKLDKFEFLRVTGTCAPNHELNNYQIVHKLKEWDTKYGVDILGASKDSVLLRFARLPKSKEQFLFNVHSFCPDSLDLRDEKQVENFVKTQELNLWWD